MQFNDPGTQHLVINEEMEDQRKKMVTPCVCMHVHLKSHTGKKKLIFRTITKQTKKPSHDPHILTILQPD